ncbi:hypothetical protein PAXRUDRAFT_403151 [Paxillus rubicundulus Ve08.2h10]|uniref:Uncharacterized protein n=1 Tax=Paxillus rubicundulus Ve08.2h10 TaxID=930991 RepID=A0A0D0C159_9AGAM|nr:hypothetical protein PAXRUDRAFT_403151 [Paxillus rubicundulus Ve08.2h10]
MSDRRCRLGTVPTGFIMEGISVLDGTVCAVRCEIPAFVRRCSAKSRQISNHAKSFCQFCQMAFCHSTGKLDLG